MKSALKNLMQPKRLYSVKSALKKFNIDRWWGVCEDFHLHGPQKISKLVDISTDGRDHRPSSVCSSISLFVSANT